MGVYTNMRYNSAWIESLNGAPSRLTRNLKKHGIGFDEASLVFDDPFCLSEQDRIEDGEERWQTIGSVAGCLLLLVAHTFHLEDEDVVVVRIISARRADKNERRRYENG